MKAPTKKCVKKTEIYHKDEGEGRNLNCYDNNHMSVIKRADIKKGNRVLIVQKKDQLTGRLTEGIVRDILTRSAAHPHGIKVRLENGQVGRVKGLMEK